MAELVLFINKVLGLFFRESCRIPHVGEGVEDAAVGRFVLIFNLHWLRLVVGCLGQLLRLAGHLIQIADLRATLPRFLEWIHK